MNRAQVVRAVLACDALAGELRRQLKADAKAEFEEQDCAATWRLKGVGTVSTSLTSDKAVVSDEAAFLDYVRDAYPTEVEEIRIVRPRENWLRAFLEGVAKRGEPVCDRDGRAVPGVVFVPGGDFHTVSIIPDDEMKAELKRAATEIAAGKRPLALPSEVDAQ